MFIVTNDAQSVRSYMFHEQQCNVKCRLAIALNCLALST